MDRNSFSRFGISVRFFSGDGEASSERRNTQIFRLIPVPSE